jgi:hypothetical protein
VFSTCPVGATPVTNHAYAPPTTTTTIDDWQLTTSYHQIIVVAFSGDSIIGGDGSIATYRDRDGAAHADLHLVAEHPTELWSDRVPACARVVTSAAFPDINTYYAVRLEDLDCDRMPDRSDCQPTVYCDPAVPSSCACP